MKMTENTLTQLSINVVFDLMAQSTKDFSQAKNKNDKPAFNLMNEQVELIRRFLVNKRSECRPG
jgi:hypothetical protein